MRTSHTASCQYSRGPRDVWCAACPYTGHRGGVHCRLKCTCATGALLPCAALPSALGSFSAGKADEPWPPVRKLGGAAAAPDEGMLLRPKPELVDGAKPEAAAPGAMLPRKPSRSARRSSAQSSTCSCCATVKLTYCDITSRGSQWLGAPVHSNSAEHIAHTHPSCHAW